MNIIMVVDNVKSLSDSDNKEIMQTIAMSIYKELNRRCIKVTPIPYYQIYKNISTEPIIKRNQITVKGDHVVIVSNRTHSDEFYKQLRTYINDGKVVRVAKINKHMEFEDVLFYFDFCGNKKGSIYMGDMNDIVDVERGVDMILEYLIPPSEEARPKGGPTYDTHKGPLLSARGNNSSGNNNNIIGYHNDLQNDHKIERYNPRAKKRTVLQCSF